jgi:hypothetical protein
MAPPLKSIRRQQKSRPTVRHRLRRLYDVLVAPMAPFLKDL